MMENAEKKPRCGDEAGLFECRCDLAAGHDGRHRCILSNGKVVD
jgi:hypothetical protein